MNLDLLSAPFPAESIHWRAQTVTKSGDKALALAYVDARDVMDHLDRVVGPENWQDSYVETPKGRVVCTIKLRIGEEWVGKSDGAGDTAVEGEKGGISDAFKRAAVKWGVARYLYDLGNVWAPCESRDDHGRKKFVKWSPAAQQVFTAALRKFSKAEGDGSAVVPVATPPTISEAQRTELMTLFDAKGINPTPYLKRAAQTTGRDVNDLRDLPASEFPDLKAHLLSKETKREIA